MPNLPTQANPPQKPTDKGNLMALALINRVAYGVDVPTPAGPDAQQQGVIVRAESARGAVRCQSVPRDNPQFMGAGEKNIPIAASLSCRESFTRLLRTPVLPRYKIAKILPTLLDIQMPFPVEECVCEFVPIRDGRKATQDVLAICARSEHVAKKLESLKEAGIEPLVLDQQGVALWALACREIPPPRDGIRVVLYFGPDQWAMALGRAGALRGTHSLRSGDAGQVRRILHSYSLPDSVTGDRNPGGVDWVLTGPNAEDRDFVAQVSVSLTQGAGDSFRTIDKPSEALARGLAVRALLGDALSCNFRKGPYAHAGALRRDLHLQRMAAGLCLLAALLLAGTSVSVEWIVKRRVQQANILFQNTCSELAGFPVAAKGELALTILSREMESRAARLRPFAAAFEPSLLDRISGVVKVAAERSMDLEALTLTSSGEASVRGTSADWDSPAMLQRWMAEQGYALRLSRDEARDDERIPYVLSAKEAP